METKARDLEGQLKSPSTTTESETKPLSISESADAPPVESVPDPDEDDLDDLDDMLDEFSTIKSDTMEETPAASGPGRPSATAPSIDRLDSEGISDDDLANQLQAGMADLLGELQNNPGMDPQFKDLLNELGGAAALEDAGQQGKVDSSARAPSIGGEDFQNTIQKMMERMQASGEQATAAAAADESDDVLAELMKQMQAGAGLDGEGSEEDFSKMLLGMMEQLTNKEILYEPMKELNDKFPEWMKKNSATTPKEDMKRYEEQQKVVGEIVAKFEEKTYTDSNVADREYIVERMQKMQAAGTPPPDLVGDMATAQEAIGAPEEGCPQQ